MQLRFAAHSWRLAVALVLLCMLPACGDSAQGGPAATATAPVSSDLPTIAPSDEPTAEANPQLTLELPPGPTTLPTPTGLDQEQQLTMYSLIARDLLVVSEATRDGTVPAYIGISDKAGQGELLDTDASGVFIPEELVSTLADLGATTAFSSFSDAIGGLDEGGQVHDNGVYLTFGTFRDDPVGGGYQLYASYYHAIDDAAGYSYVLSREGNSWKIKDRTEVWSR